MRDSDKPMSQREAYQRGYAAGYAAAQSGPPKEPTQAMIDAGEKRRREIAGRGLCIGTIWCAMYDAWAQEQTSGETQQRPEQANASKPESRTGPPGHQSAAGTNCAAECAVRAPESFARGPAADPIADLCVKIRAQPDPLTLTVLPFAYVEVQRELLHKAADALERLARERDVLSDTLADTRLRAERAEAERNALRECVRAADGLRAECDQVPPMVQQRNVLHAYDAARAKVNTTEGEK